LVLFLGGTIGNLDDDDRNVFLSGLRSDLAPAEHLLLGADLVKSPSRLLAAYDDRAGVTAEFNRNLIEVLRTQLDAEGLYVDDFQHVVRWNPDQHRIELWLRARRDVSAYFQALCRDCQLAAGMELLTEISVKFRLPELSVSFANAPSNRCGRGRTSTATIRSPSRACSNTQRFARAGQDHRTDVTYAAAPAGVPQRDALPNSCEIGSA
jgi:uncharacterized SAM-dependent methyltransferase